MKRLTPQWVFIWLAALIALIYLVANALGWRARTAFLSGSALPSAGALWAGLVYVLAYFAFQVGVPILLLAAGIRVGLERVVRSKGPAGREPAS